MFSALISALSSLTCLCNSRWCLKLSPMSLTLAGFLKSRRLSHFHFSPMSPALTIALNSHWCVFSALISALSSLACLCNSRWCLKLSSMSLTLAGFLNSRRLSHSHFSPMYPALNSHWCSQLSSVLSALTREYLRLTPETLTNVINCR